MAQTTRAAAAHRKLQFEPIDASATDKVSVGFSDEPEMTLISSPYG